MRRSLAVAIVVAVALTLLGVGIWMFYREAVKRPPREHRDEVAFTASIVLILLGFAGALLTVALLKISN